MFQLATLLGLPLWLELAAPAVLAYGFAPAPRKAPAEKKAKRRKVKRAPRKPASPAKAAQAQRAPLKLVGTDDA
jgi:hypothetical protein